MRHHVRRPFLQRLGLSRDARDCRIQLITTSGTCSDGNFVVYLQERFTSATLLMMTELEQRTATKRMSRIKVNPNKTKTDGVKAGLSDLGQNQRYRSWSLNRREQSTSTELHFRSSRINTVIIVRAAISPISATVSVVTAGWFQFKF